VGVLTPFFWNSAAAVQKGSAEMTRLVTAFHGYMGRMRLLGLGFADLFTRDSFEITLKELSYSDTAAGRVSAQSPVANSDVGPGTTIELTLSKGPKPSGEAKPAEVPPLTGMALDTAQEAVLAAKLRLKVEDFGLDLGRSKGEILSQDIPPDTQVAEGTTIGVTVNIGKQP
jgi:eukaryotic-like serine/threonine-protein kinase